MSCSVESSPSGLPSLPQNFNIYEISTRPWLYSLTQKYNRSITQIDQIPDVEFQNIKKLGFDMVWLMGMWQLGQYGLNFDRQPAQMVGFRKKLPGCTIQDVIGSPYAVVNYTTNAQIGNDLMLAALKQKLNKMGLRLMLDFVPNHSAVDAQWMTTHPEYYVRAPKGQQPPYPKDRYLPNGVAYGWAGWGGGWMDTAQLNYFNPALVKQRIQQLMNIAALSDGIRCDMAFLLLNDQFDQHWASNVNSYGYHKPSQEFWKIAIAAVKTKFPDIIFLAEAYQPFQYPLQQLGFDYTYDKHTLDLLAAHNVAALQGHIGQAALTYTEKNAHFLSNHDEERAVEKFGQWYIADAAAIFTFTIPGMRFWWMGQLEGYQYQLAVQLRRERPSPVIQAVKSFYPKLLEIVSTPVFRQGKFEWISTANTQLMAYRWSFNGQKRLCVVNFTPNNENDNVLVTNAAPQANGNDTIPVRELLSGKTYYRSASDMRTKGLYVAVNSWWGQIFEY